MRNLSRILCVEDEPDIRAIIQITLESLGGFNVAVCSSGEEAMTEAPHFEPDLILLDVMMPGLDGYDTFAGLRTLPSLGTTPVVFMTAKTQSNEILKLRDVGAIDVISKPFDPITLPDRVRSIWTEQVGNGVRKSFGESN